MTRKLALVLTALLAGAAPAPATFAAEQPRAPATDWSQRVELTAEGGWRMGNPDAPVKLVEYASITCGHCATFATAASAPLKDRHIRTGRVSWEVRPYLIFPSDPGIFTLLRCESPDKFFALSDRLYETQEAWVQNIIADEQRLLALPRERKLEGFVRSAKIDQLFRERGMSEERLSACLNDEAAIQRLAALHNGYARAGIEGTPTFFINGQEVGVNTWDQLEPLLGAAAPN